MQFKWNQKKKIFFSKMILLGSILGKGRWWCFLVLDGMRLCECLDFFFQMNCKIFHGNNRQDTYDRACISNPWWGWGICLGYTSTSQMRKYGGGWGGQGWGGVGQDTAAGTMDYKTMLEPKVGLKT